MKTATTEVEGELQIILSEDEIYEILCDIVTLVPPNYDLTNSSKDFLTLIACHRYRNNQEYANTIIQAYNDSKKELLF